MRRMTFKARGGPKTDLSLEITMPRANISPADWNQLGYPIQHYIREYFNGDEHSTAREEIRSRQGILIDSWLIDWRRQTASEKKSGVTSNTFFAWDFRSRTFRGKEDQRDSESTYLSWPTHPSFTWSQELKDWHLNEWNIPSGWEVGLWRFVGQGQYQNGRRRCQPSNTWEFEFHRYKMHHMSVTKWVIIRGNELCTVITVEKIHRGSVTVESQIAPQTYERDDIRERNQRKWDSGSNENVAEQYGVTVPLKKHTE